MAPPASWGLVPLQPVPPGEATVGLAGGSVGSRDAVALEQARDFQPAMRMRSVSAPPPRRNEGVPEPGVQSRQARLGATAAQHHHAQVEGMHAATASTTGWIQARGRRTKVPVLRPAGGGSSR